MDYFKRVPTLNTERQNCAVNRGPYWTRVTTQPVKAKNRFDTSTCQCADCLRYSNQMYHLDESVNEHKNTNIRVRV